MVKVISEIGKPFTSFRRDKPTANVPVFSADILRKFSRISKGRLRYIAVNFVLKKHPLFGFELLLLDSVEAQINSSKRDLERGDVFSLEDVVKGRGKE